MYINQFGSGRTDIDGRRYDADVISIPGRHCYINASFGTLGG